MSDTGGKSVSNKQSRHAQSSRNKKSKKREKKTKSNVFSKYSALDPTRILQLDGTRAYKPDLTLSQMEKTDTPSADLSNIELRVLIARHGFRISSIVTFHHTHTRIFYKWVLARLKMLSMWQMITLLNPRK